MKFNLVKMTPKYVSKMEQSPCGIGVLVPNAIGGLSKIVSICVIPIHYL